MGRHTTCFTQNQMTEWKSQGVSNACLIIQQFWLADVFAEAKRPSSLVQHQEYRHSLFEKGGDVCFEIDEFKKLCQRRAAEAQPIHIDVDEIDEDEMKKGVLSGEVEMKPRKEIDKSVC